VDVVDLKIMRSGVREWRWYPTCKEESGDL